MKLIVIFSFFIISLTSSVTAAQAQTYNNQETEAILQEIMNRKSIIKNCQKLFQEEQYRLKYLNANPEEISEETADVYSNPDIVESFSEIYKANIKDQQKKLDELKKVYPELFPTDVPNANIDGGQAHRTDIDPHLLQQARELQSLFDETKSLGESILQDLEAIIEQSKK